MPDKYVDEIEEILRKAGETAPRKSSKESEGRPEDRSREPVLTRPAPSPQSRPGPKGPTITAGKLMLLGVIALLIGIKIAPFIWIGLAMLAGGYLLYFVKPRPAVQEKRWRGRSVDEDPPTSWERLKRWLRS